MDPQAEGLQFLDWSSMEDPERCMLHTILYGTAPPERTAPPELAALPEHTVPPEHPLPQHVEAQSPPLPPEEWTSEEQQQEIAPVESVPQPPQGWEQPDYGTPMAVSQQQQPRGPPVPVYPPMVPPPVLPAPPGGPPPAGPSQSNVNAIYPLIMPTQSGMILGNVNLSVNANVQSYVTPMSAGGYHHQHQQQGQYEQYEKDKRRSGSNKANKSKREYKQAEEQMYQFYSQLASNNDYPVVTHTQYPSQFIYPAYPNYIQPHSTAQQVQGHPVYFNLPHHPVYANAPHTHHPQQMFYSHSMPYLQMHPMQAIPMQQQEVMSPEPVQQQPPVMEQQQTPIMEHHMEQNDYSVPPPEQTVLEVSPQEIAREVSPQPGPVVMHQVPAPVVAPPVAAMVQQQILEEEHEHRVVPSSSQPPLQEQIPMPVSEPLEQTTFDNMEHIKAELPHTKPAEVTSVTTTPSSVPAPSQSPHEKSAEPAVTAGPAMKSWASIVQASAQPQPQESLSMKPLARVNPFSSNASQQQGTGAAPPTNSNHNQKSPPPQPENANVSMPLNMSMKPQAQDAMLGDPVLYRLGEHLGKYVLDHRSSALQPRGLTNRSNWCYVNATLQALLACPPFFNLMRNLPVRPQNRSRQSQTKSATPIIDAVVEFMQQFSTLPPGSRPARKEKAAARRAAPGDENSVVDVPQGTPFEPSCVYAMLGSIKSSAFSAVEGRQEDAEEFLSCLLNALNDEMLELMKLVDSSEPVVMNGGQETVTNGEHHSEEDEEEWTVMRGKNRACLTRRSDFGRTPVSDIFRGQLCSHVQRKGEQQSETVQPFYTLQLDIEKARSVKDALELMVDRDRLEGVTCSRTQQQVEAWQQVTLEELPPVLLLHLKWFDYKQDGCSKIMKSMEYTVDLKIENKLLSNSKAKYSPKQRIYKLFAVVYHDGKEASKGHYITDAYHSAMGVWVRYDDSQVRVVSEYTVTHPRSPAVPYILYYRRSDTMGQPSLNH